MWVRARFCKLQKGCIRPAAASDKVYQLHAHDRWFSPGIPASSTTKTGRHDIAEILLKMALKHQKSINLIVLFRGERRQKLTIVWNPTVNVYKRAMIMVYLCLTNIPIQLFQGSEQRISPTFKNGIIRLEASTFKFLHNQLFMTSMQLPRKRDVPSSAISKMSRSLPWRHENNMRYSAK